MFIGQYIDHKTLCKFQRINQGKWSKERILAKYSQEIHVNWFIHEHSQYRNLYSSKKPLYVIRANLLKPFR